MKRRGIENYRPVMERLEMREQPATLNMMATAAAGGHGARGTKKPVTPDLNKIQATATTVTYQADGEQLTLLKPNATAQPANGWPVLFAIHGGGWYRFDRNNILAGLGHMPDVGVAVVAPDYALAKANQPSWPDNLNNLMNALDWVLNNAAEYGLDSTKITLMGQSAGGHLAALLAIAESGRLDESGGPLVDGLVSVSGPVDLPGLVGESAFAAGKAQAMLGASFKADPGLWRAASPQWILQTNADINMPTVLLIHGTADPVVPVDQSIAFESLLKRRNATVTLVQMEKAGHELLKGRTGKKVQALVLDFIQNLFKQA